MTQVTAKAKQLHMTQVIEKTNTLDTSNCESN